MGTQQLCSSRRHSLNQGMRLQIHPHLSTVFIGSCQKSSALTQMRPSRRLRFQRTKKKRRQKRRTKMRVVTRQRRVMMRRRKATMRKRNCEFRGNFCTARCGGDNFLFVHPKFCSCAIAAETNVQGGC